MERTIQFEKLFFIALVLFFSFSSCQSNSEKKEKNSRTDELRRDADLQSPRNENFMPGKLDTLFMTAASFDTLSHLMIFAFVFDGNGKMSMGGWHKKLLGKIKDAPSIMLSNGKPSTLGYQAGSFLITSTLENDQITKIRKIIKNQKASYVLFAPDISVIPNLLNYKIYVANEDPLALVKTLAITETGVTTNPCPPKSY
ncbi:MAG: hypothetical protein ABIT96_10055 [Ferruginibacter sp.]